MNPIGSGMTLFIVCAILGLLCRTFRRPRLHGAAWLGVLSFSAAGLLEFTLKHLVGRPRPDAAMSNIGLGGPSFLREVDSFPSGHATSVFTVATVFALFYPRLGLPLYALAAAIAAGRVYLDRHHVSDVVAGALIGIVIASYMVRNRAVLLRWMPAEPAAHRAGGIDAAP